MHPEKFFSREQPAEVMLPQGLFGPGSTAVTGWEIADTDVMGEFFLLAWLEAIGAASSDAATAAAGWGGDAHQLAINDAGEFALAAKITWDDPSADADEFAIVLSGVMGQSPDFERIDIGPMPGVSAFESPGGVVVAATLSGSPAGKFSVVTAAPGLGDAMALMLALAN
jgi:hypothetical protein